MPHSLVIILVPKKVQLDENGDIVIERPVVVKSEITPTTESTEEGVELPAKNPSTTTIKRQRSNTHDGVIDDDFFSPPAPPGPLGDRSDRRSTSSLFDINTNVKSELKTQFFDLKGNISKPAELVQEVDLRTYLLECLDTLFRQDYICNRPTIVDDETGNSLEALCICERSSLDMVVARLGHIGVGSLVGSVNVISLESSKFLKSEKTDEDEAKIADAREAKTESAKEEEKMFLEVASQIRVEQVVEAIEAAATFSFDYLSLLTIASTIAGIGLATNNTVAIVASMLVSPIMGPVLALTFGTIINDMSLMRLGLANELLSLLLCVVIGFIIGAISIGIGTDHLWPTDEMRGRGMVDGLAIGLAIAIPSGIGVALSVLGNNTSSLVGVAISASLLPPAVNCGMAFAYAAFGFEADPSPSDDNSYSTSDDYLNMGGISLSLTLINIGAIFISAMAMFRLKEVAPIQNKTVFWQQDVKMSRKINANLRARFKDKQKLAEIRDDLLALAPNRTEGVGVADALSTTRQRPVIKRHRSVFEVFNDLDTSNKNPVRKPPAAAQAAPTVAIPPPATNISDIRDRFKQHAHALHRSNSSLK